MVLVLRPDLRRYYATAIGLMMIPGMLSGLYLGMVSGASGALLIRPDIDVAEATMRGTGWLLTSLALLAAFRR